MSIDENAKKKSVEKNASKIAITIAYCIYGNK